VDLAGIPERIVSLAVARDARFVFAAAQGKESGALYLLKPGQEPLMLMPLGKAGVIRLAGDALFIADRGRNEVLRLTNWERIPNVAALATVGQGLEDPVGFAVEAEKKLLYVASGGTRQVLGIDTQTGTVKETLELDFAPTGMERLGAGPLFALGGWESGAPLLDTRAARAVLVPVNFPAGD
jgi:DNA-binding beta-propeller fold protein YncE